MRPLEHRNAQATLGRYASARTPIELVDMVIDVLLLNHREPMELTCEEFLSYDEVTRPQIVYWSEGLNGKGKPETAVIDIARVNGLIPVLVDDCRKEPQTSYWAKLKQESKKHF